MCELFRVVYKCGGTTQCYLRCDHWAVPYVPGILRKYQGSEDCFYVVPNRMAITHSIHPCFQRDCHKCNPPPAAPEGEARR
ncbi:hypothetical protein SAMD00023353_0204010 [Rosellinia necatrix]|uniref:Uncharacterized protein n=1 Tax=Rosellinia necatrix TaxID=77044 RepID=A0A1S8A583_ROSNE|nr:hypothetical protein SAMD00023353_0204010 [Rosellinia necatrix]